MREFVFGKRKIIHIIRADGRRALHLADRDSGLAVYPVLHAVAAEPGEPAARVAVSVVADDAFVPAVAVRAAHSARAGAADSDTSVVDADRGSIARVVAEPVVRVVPAPVAAVVAIAVRVADVAVGLFAVAACVRSAVAYC